MKQKLLYLAALLIISLSSCGDPEIPDGGIYCIGGDFVNLITDEETGKESISTNEYLFSFITRGKNSSVSILMNNISIPKLDLAYLRFNDLPYSIEDGAYCITADTITPTVNGAPLLNTVFTDLKAKVNSNSSSISYKVVGQSVSASMLNNRYFENQIEIANTLEPEKEPYKYKPSCYATNLDLTTLSATISIHKFNPSESKEGINLYLTDLKLTPTANKLVITADNATAKTDIDGVELIVTDLYAEVVGNKLEFKFTYDNKYSVTGKGESRL